MVNKINKNPRKITNKTLNKKSAKTKTTEKKPAKKKAVKKKATKKKLVKNPLKKDSSLDLYQRIVASEINLSHNNRKYLSKMEAALIIVSLVALVAIFALLVLFKVF